MHNNVLVNVQRTPHKIVLQMHVLFELLTPTVKLNFTQVYHVITTHMQYTRFWAETLMTIVCHSAPRKGCFLGGSYSFTKYDVFRFFMERSVSSLMWAELMLLYIVIIKVYSNVVFLKLKWLSYLP